MLDLKPNWIDRVSVKREFRTEILVARDGSEQRLVLRQDPRKTVEFNTLHYGGERQRLGMKLATLGRSEQSLPDPTRKTRCLALSGAVMTVDNVEHWLVAGQDVVLDDTVSATIDSISDDIVTLTSAPSLTPPFTVRPMLVGFLSGEIVPRPRTSQAWELSVEFDVAPGSETQPSMDEDLRIHAGRLVWALPPDWADDPDLSVTQSRQTVDPGHGIYAHFHPVAWAERLQSWDFAPLLAEDIAYIETMFVAARGRAGEFLLPTFLDDATPVASLGEGTQALTVAGQHLLGIESDPVYRYLRIKLADGRAWYRTVTDSTAAGDDTLLTVDRAFVETVPAGSVLQISLMSVARFAADELVTEWETSSVAIIRVNFSSLPPTTSEETVPDVSDALWILLELFDGAEGSDDYMDRVDVLLNSDWAGLY